MSTSVPVLNTERLTLRPFEMTDAPRVRELAGAKEVADLTLTIPHPYPVGAAESWIQGHPLWVEKDLIYTWAITLKGNGLLLGCISLKLNRHHKRGELGYWLGVRYWSNGYTSEAAEAVVLYSFQNLKLHRIQAMCYPRNQASARVMEKAGMTYEGHLHEYLYKGDTFEDLLVYAVLNPLKS